VYSADIPHPLGRSDKPTPAPPAFTGDRGRLAQSLSAPRERRTRQLHHCRVIDGQSGLNVPQKKAEMDNFVVQPMQNI
jgi:hypothetical protein